MNKVMVAFTGGLQSSVCVHWLHDNGYKVKAFVAELGQKAPTWEIGEYAVRIGAEGAHIEDCREEFCRDYAFRALKASAVYQQGYLLSGALARPLIAAALARLAGEEGSSFVSLGACGGSNDLARFRATVAALDRKLTIIGPEEIEPLQSRETAIRYAEEHNIIPQEGAAPCMSYDANLWGVCLAHDPSAGTWVPLPRDMYQLTVPPTEALPEPETVTLKFERGAPVAVNGEKLPAHTLVKRMNEIGGRHGVGRTELIEDRLAGLKAREAYEAPGATALMLAHDALEELVLDYDALNAKSEAGRRYAELVYAGGWFSTLRRALDAFLDVTQEYVTGEVRLELFRGHVSVSGRRSSWSLYHRELVEQHETDGPACRSADVRSQGVRAHRTTTRPRIEKQQEEDDSP